MSFAMQPASAASFCYFGVSHDLSCYANPGLVIPAAGARPIYNQGKMDELHHFVDMSRRFVPLGRILPESCVGTLSNRSIQTKTPPLNHPIKSTSREDLATHMCTWRGVHARCRDLQTTAASACTRTAQQTR